MSTNNNWNSQNPAQVALGGTGDSSLTAYSVLCGGTTSTGVVQSVASLGTVGQYLVSNGSALPTWQTVSPSGFGALKLLQTIVCSGQSNIVFTNTYITSAYSIYLVKFNLVHNATYACVCDMSFSTNNGSTYLTSSNLGGALEYDYNGNITVEGSALGFLPIAPGGGITNNKGSGYGGLWLYGLGVSGYPRYTGNMHYANSSGIVVPAIIYGYNSASAITVNNIKFTLYNATLAAYQPFTNGSISLYGLSQ